MTNSNVSFVRLALPDFRQHMEQLHRNWGWLMAMGVALLVLGIVCLSVAGITTLASTVLFGAMLAISGAMQIIHAFSFRVGHGFFLNVIMGVLYTVLGLMMLAYPVVGAASLTLLVAGFFVAGGICRCIWSAVTRYSSWGWTFFSGIVAIAVGFYLAANLPSAALWLIGTCVGVELLASGGSWIMLASAARAYEPVEDLVAGESPEFRRRAS